MKLLTFLTFTTLAGLGTSASALAWECRGVTINQQAPKTVHSNEELTYDVRIENGSDCDLVGVVVTDTLPRLTAFKTADPIPTAYPGKSTHDSPPPLPVDTVQWDDVHLKESRSAAEFHVTLQVNAPAGRTITNSICFEHPKTGRICSLFDTAVRANVR